MSGGGTPARLQAYELVGLADLTEPVQVWPCRHCASWYAEVYRDSFGLGVREWHDERCRQLLSLLRDDDGDGAGPV